MVEEKLKKLIETKELFSQHDICSELAQLGYNVSQSKVNRLLKKIGAIKIKNSKSELVYSMPNEPVPPAVRDKISSLIIDIRSNEINIIIQTSPGSAQLIARILDYNKSIFDIMGVVAGDDTILVIPNSIKTVSESKTKIEDYFFD